MQHPTSQRPASSTPPATAQGPGRPHGDPGPTSPAAHHRTRRPHDPTHPTPHPTPHTTHHHHTHHPHSPHTRMSHDDGHHGNGGTSDGRRAHLRPVPPPDPHPTTDTSDTAPEAPTTPHDVEQLLLGTLLTPTDDPTHLLIRETILDQLTPGDFHNPTHETIYDTIQTLHHHGEPISWVTVAHHAQHDTTIRRAGGTHYLATLAGAGTNLPVITNAPHYATLITTAAEHRAWTKAHDDIARTLADPPPDPGALADAITTTITTTAARTRARTDPPPTTWAPEDLTNVLAGHDTGPRPTTLLRRDGTPLLYPSAIHSIAGEPSSGKSWLAVLGVAQALLASHDALYVDFEDRSTSLVARLRAVGVPDHAIAAHLRYIRPDTPLDATCAHHLDTAATGTTIAIIDGVTEGMNLHGLSMMDNDDVVTWLKTLPKRLVNHGPAVLQVDHVVKDPEARGRYAIGGGHKLAGLDGAAYKAVVTKPMSRGTHGTTRIIIDKDRHGHVGPTGHTIAELHLDATQPTQTLLWMDEPANTTTETGAFRPTAIMEKISAYLSFTPGATTNAIDDNIPGKAQHIRAALRALIAEGHIATTPGPRNSTCHTLLTPYRQADDHT